MVIFLDTYAIIEIDKGSSNYKKYALKPIAAITTLFNLVEVYFVYLKKSGEEEATRIYNEVRPLTVNINYFIIKKAMKFKIENEKKRYSIADCIGYATAIVLNAKFLTGDYAFKDIENVEFVK